MNRSLNKRNNGLSFQSRLVLSVLLAAVIPLIIIATRDTLQTQQALKNGAEVSLKSGASQLANSVDIFIQSTLDSVAGEAEFSDFITYLTLYPTAPPITQARAQDLLNKLRDKSDNKYIISYALVDTNGIVLLDTLNLNIKNNESNEAYFPLARVFDEPIVTPITYSKDKTSTITFASKVRNINGNFVGVLRAIYNPAILQDVIIKNVGAVTDVSVLILDDFHIRMADSQNPELVLKSVAPLDTVDYFIAVNSRRFLVTPPEEQATNYLDLDLALDNASAQPFFNADITPDTEGDDTIAVAFMNTQPWIVVYSRPTSIFLAAVQQQIRTNVILVFATIIMIYIVAAFIARSFSNPIQALAKVVNSISQGDLNARANINTTDEIGVLASAFNSMAERLSKNLTGLEERVAKRTDELQIANEMNSRRAAQFESIAHVARSISSTQTMSELLPQITSTISERFDFYHVAIFLLDTRREYAVLAAANSKGGKKMLERNHRLLVGGAGIVGLVTGSGQPRVALNVGQDSAYFNNPDLPDTLSEITLPLSIGSNLFGALDVQSKQTNAFTQEDINILSILADQVSIAIQNARSSQQILEALAQAESSSAQLNEQQWKQFLTHQDIQGFSFDGLGVTQVKQSDKQRPHSLAIPLTLRGTKIGVIKLNTSDPDRMWTDDEIAMVQAAAERTSLALESARLLKEAQKRAAKERVIGEISAKIGSSSNLENILQTAIQELGSTLPNTDIAIQFTSEKSGRA